jgi:hypothetical protein
VRRSPEQFGHVRSRWTLASLLASCSWLRLRSQPGLHRLLRRLGIHYKRGRSYIHSPDPDYEAKLALIAACRQRVRAEPDRFVLLYSDEFSYYRQPTLAADYEEQGQKRPLARRSYRSNTCGRIVAALNAETGQVIYRQFSKINLRHLVAFYAALCDAYPQAEVIYLVVDNWPIHYHPDVMATLVPQQLLRWPPKLSSSWSLQPKRHFAWHDLPIQLLGLPTYASWSNPIEKLWRWLTQDVLHLHRSANDWPALKARIADFLDQFDDASPALLRYTGLLPD